MIVSSVPTILHEIAHALVGEKYNHCDKIFIDMCKRLGCDASSKAKVKMPRSKKK